MYITTEIHSGMNGKYDVFLLIMNNFIIQFQCDSVFFSTEIVDYNSCYWVPLINFAKIKLYQEAWVSYEQVILCKCILSTLHN